MRFYLALAAVCGSVMALQILQSRIFSVVSWYHLSFLTISIAMFGLTVGALDVYRKSGTGAFDDLPQTLRDLSFLLGKAIVLALVFQLLLPIIHTSILKAAITLPAVAGITAIGYYYAGKIVALCLTRSGLPAGKVYGADLLGAAFGCLATLLLMKIFDAPSAILLTGGAVILNGFLFEPGKMAENKRAILFGIAFCLMGLVNAAAPKPFIYPLWVKSARMPQSIIEYEQWNPISRVTIIEPGKKSMPVFLWGTSPNLPDHYKEGDPTGYYKVLSVDGAAITPLSKFDGKDFEAVDYLNYDITNIFHFLPGIKKMAIVGLGGGRDLLSALYFKAEEVVALDINSTQISLATEDPVYKNYTNLWQHDGVRIINSEARSWFTRSDEKFDAIQMSMIDTWVAVGAGAYALTENSLYTTDAWKIFLSRVNDHGVLTVSRWHFGDSYNDLGRLVVMTMTALMEMGVEDPSQNIFIVHTDRIATLVIGRSALTEEQVSSLTRAADKYGYDILAAPGRAARGDVLKNILESRTGDDIAKAIAGLPFDLTAPTDHRPFFFNQAHIQKPLQVLAQANSYNFKTQNLRGHAIATLNLYIIILFSVIASLLVLVLPYRKALDNAPGPFIISGTVYFTLIGTGFMFVEITLMQVMGMFLGHPIYGLRIVLFSLILSTGLGSLLSEKIRLDSAPRILIWTAILSAYIFGLTYFMDSLLHQFIQSELPARIALCVALLTPCGMMMGFAFPLGMRLTDRISSALTPWFWGINGAAGVMASALAMFISIGWGLDATLTAGALCYALLAIPALRLAGQRL